jgi:ferric-dicitrate binding protein FerR (iron transport regulator)
LIIGCVKRFGCCFAVFILMLSAIESRAQAQTVGTVTSLQGSAQDQRGTVALPVALNMPVLLHDLLITSAGASLILLLTDNSKVSLGESAKLSIDEHLVGPGGTRGGTIMKLLSGSVHSLVSSSVGRPFNYQIRTSNSIIAVRGTDFEVDYTAGKARIGYNGCGIYTDVRVHDGTVEVQNPAHPEVKIEVTGGFATTVPCDAPPLNPGPIGLAAHAVVSSAVSALPAPTCPVCIMVHPH